MDWWKEYFDEVYLKIYSQVDQDERIKREVDFIERVLELKKGMKVLDVGCGQGRHVIEFATRGHDVTGFDYSEYLLSVARKRAEHIGIPVKFVQGDMREIPFINEFDAAYLFFTTFGYFSDEDNFKTLKKISDVLKKGGKILIDQFNPFRALKEFQKKSWILTEEGIMCLDQNELDLLKMQIKTLRIIFKDGKEIQRKEHFVRLYTPAEISYLLNLVGIHTRQYYGDYNFSQFNENSSRLIIIGEKL